MKSGSLIAFFAVAVLQGFTLPEASAAPRKTLGTLRPDWCDSLAKIQTNSSYLSLRNARFYSTDWQLFSEKIFDKEWAQSAQLQWDDFNRRFETAKAYGTMKGVEEADWTTQRERMSGQIINSAFERQATREIKPFTENAERTFANMAGSKKPEPNPSAGPIAPASFKNTSVANGQTTLIPVKKDPFMRVVPRTDLAGLRGQLWFQNTITDSYLDFVGGNPLANPTVAGFVNRMPGYFGLGSTSLDRENSERVRFSMRRTLPIWQLQSGLSYGFSSALVTASVCKQLSPHLRAELAQLQPTDPSRSGSAVGDQRITFSYDLHF